jgi:hypothetical protein
MTDSALILDVKKMHGFTYSDVSFLTAVEGSAKRKSQVTLRSNVGQPGTSYLLKQAQVIYFNIP